MPLSVDGGLNDPQAFIGVQLQATPACVLSFDTVAETAVEPPGTTLDDNGDNTTEMGRDCVPDCVPGGEELSPQPTLNRARIKAVIENSDSPVIPFFKFIGPPNLGAARFR